jgi:hypothetical protein
MKFKQLLNEKFFDGLKVFGQYVEVFKNPSSSEVKELSKKIKQWNGIRGVVDNKNNMYVWISELAQHTDIINKFRLQANWQFIYEPDRKSLELYILDDFTNEQMNKMYKRFKNLFGQDTKII